MAICDVCSNDMRDAETCTASELHRDGTALAVFRYGDDPGWRTRRGRCPDCGVKVGGFHHLGCDVQACPRCRRQLISCGCDWDEFPAEEDPFDEDADADADVIPLVPVVTAARSILPFAAAVAPMRARHHGAVAAVAAWCLEYGRTCHRDEVALCLDVLEEHRGDDGYALDRPTVMHLLRIDMFNTASMLRTVLPTGVVEAMWNVLSSLHESGRLTGIVPIDVLREPLRCYGGLGADGLPMPRGDDIDFGCQCYVPYDPTLPAGIGKHHVGRDPDTYESLYALGSLHPRREDPSAEDTAPLLLYATHLLRHSLFDIAPDEFTFAGRVIATRSGPELWIYRTTRADRSRAHDLTLDSRGHPWRPRIDRRFRGGFRWEQTSHTVAAIWAGLPGREDLAG